MKKEAQRITDMMGIGNLLERMPSQLSGGQQQRVALGRALIKNLLYFFLTNLFQTWMHD